MNPNQYPKEVYNLMYTGESGEVVGLDEVQLLDPIPVERVPPLTNLLDNEDAYLAYQSGLILAAWGVEEGVEFLKHLVTIRIDKVGEFEPHRLWGEDNIYDVIADALWVAVLSDYNKAEIVDIIKSILNLYGECYFESKLKRVLIKLDDRSLLPNIKQAMQSALAHERYYQASQLLPVLAWYDNDYAIIQIGKFQSLTNKDKRIRYNLDEMQQYL